MATRTPWLRPEQVLAGEGIDVAEVGGDVTVSGEDATSANKGIANFPTTDFDVVAGAVAIALHKYRARAYKSAALQGVNGDEKIVLDAETYDPESDFDSAVNYRYTAPVAGLYLAIGGLTWSNAIDAMRGAAKIYVNGALRATSITHYSHSGYAGSFVVDVLALSASDFVELYGWQSTGVDKNVYNDTSYTYLTVVRLD